MLEVWRGGSRYRGGDPAAGVATRHAFSFSGSYDPDNVRFGLLVACNEEQLAPGAGFDLHPHRDLEIVTWVVSGELEHRDSEGHTARVRPGDLQRLGAGAGIRHIERNPGDEPLRFVQMWLVPGTFGGEPVYEVVRGIADATPFAIPGTDAVLHVRRLGEAEVTAVPDAAWVYVHVVRGTVRVDAHRLSAGDAARITGADGLAATAERDTELLVWEMHAEPVYG
ncbi:pirin family protein [Streptomyces sp. TR06-5]|uniref:pirin family protein n=1 Tax=unclassified Streptomyces TaxID=2593676 RepID=UPI0039A252CD